MSISVADINKWALDAVAGAISGVVHDATMSDNAQGSYDVASGAYSDSSTTYTGGRAVIDTVKPPQDVFPEYVAGPAEQLIWLEGFTTVAAENWSLTFNGATRQILRVQDVLESGGGFYVLAIKEAP